MQSSLQNISEEQEDDTIDDKSPLGSPDLHIKGLTGLGNTKRKLSAWGLSKYGSKKSQIFDLSNRRSSSIYSKLNTSNDISMKEDIKPLITSKDEGEIVLKRFKEGEEFKIQKTLKRCNTDPDDKDENIVIKKANSWIKKKIKISGSLRRKKREITSKNYKKRVSSDLTDFEVNTVKLFGNTGDLGFLARKQENLLHNDNTVVSDEMQNTFVEKKKIEKMDNHNKRLSDLMNKINKKFICIGVALWF
jgi:hypothetical protein